jgi:hypothetical protein
LRAALWISAWGHSWNEELEDGIREGLDWHEQGPTERSN